MLTHKSWPMLLMLLISLLSINVVSAYTFQEYSPTSDSVRLSLNSGKSTGDMIAIDVLAYEVSNVYSAAFDVNFDSSVLQWAGSFTGDPNGYEEGTFFGTSAWYGIGNEINANGVKNMNKLVAGVMGEPANPKTGSGSIMTIKFMIVGSGTTTVSFSNNNLIRPDMSFSPSTTWYGGTFVSGGIVDTTPPQRSNGQPSGTLAAGTTQTPISLTTDENAMCRYSTMAGTAYASMIALATTGGSFHSTAVTGLQNGNTYYFYVKCNDYAGNVNTNDYVISFSIGTIPPVTTHPPVFDSIIITPANPTKYQTLTCLVSVSDAGGNLNNVYFKWYVNSVLARETNELVYGASGTTYDTFSGNKEVNDNIVCEAKVYDSNGAYATANHAVHVGTIVSNSLPQISYVDITPRHPNPQQDLTCSVFATDTDDNLDHVIFEWFVNGMMIRSADKRIEGSSDVASDLLDASRTRQGDSVRCGAHVYDANGAEDRKDSVAVTIGYGSIAFSPYYPPSQPYSPSYTPYNQKPVAVLSVNNQCAKRNETIQLSGSGSYDPYGGSVIQYQFDYGDGQQSAWLPDSTPYAYHSYSTTGTYYARLKVKDEQYTESAWSNPVAICVGEACGYPSYIQKPVAVLTASKQYVNTNETIYFSGSSSYDPYGREIIQYMFDYGDGQQSAWLPDSTPYAYHSYSTTGTYYARLKVKDEQYTESAWSNPVAICVAYHYGEYYEEHDRLFIDDISILKEPGNGYIRFECKVEAFDRDGDLDHVRFKWYFNNELTLTENENVQGSNDEATSEINIQATPDDSIKCEAIVYDVEHNFISATATAGGPSEGAGCGLNVNRFDYVTFITEGRNGWVETEVENTGKSGTLTMKLYVDGSLKDHYSKYLIYTEKTAKRFEFPLSVGTHKVMIESRISSCGSSVNKSTEISVFPLTSSGFVPSGPTTRGGTGEITETNVRITPASLDIEINNGGIVSVYIESPVQAKFNISVRGLPENWTNYEKDVEVKGSETAFIYIVPKTVGNYNFAVKVKGGNKTFEQGIALYAAPAAKQEGGMGGIGAGLVSALKSNWLMGAVILVALAVLTVLYFVAGRAKKKSYENHVYGERKAPYYGPYYQKKATSYPSRPSYPVHRPPQPPQRITKASASAADVPKPAVVPHAAEKRDLYYPPKFFTGRYSDGADYPKYGEDFIVGKGR